MAVWGDAISDQYTPPNPRQWPGRPDAYSVRVDMENIKYTTLYKARMAFMEAGGVWKAAWVITTIDIDTDLL